MFSYIGTRWAYENVPIVRSVVDGAGNLVAVPSNRREIFAEHADDIAQLMRAR